MSVSMGRIKIMGEAVMSDKNVPFSLTERYKQKSEQTRQDHDEIHSEPVTLKEINDRMALRHKPQTAPTLTPDGGLPPPTSMREQSMNERRIGFIRNRLNRFSGKARDDFDRSR